MLASQYENYFLAHAYVPEPIVGLITSLSAEEPFLIDDHFCCRKDDWVIFNGYYSKKNYVLGASDLLLMELIKIME